MLHDRLLNVFRTVFNDDDLVIDDRTSVTSLPGWDSVAHINLMFSIEETFGIQFAGNELAEFKDVGQLKSFLVSKGCACMLWVSAMAPAVSMLADGLQGGC
jgi:acyl carrier protein